MSTLKSLLPQAFAVSNIHPRPRKHLSRYTLDCGFKTSESPALRGFVGGLQALATAALYLVLKSNGLRHSKNLPVKFVFSLKIVPATIAKKLPPQRCFKPLLIPIFNFPHKRPMFAFTGESGYTLAFTNRIAHKRLHAETGTFPPPATAGLCASSEFFYSATLLYTYISRFSVNPHHRQTEKIRQSCRLKLYLKPFLIPIFNFSHKWPTFAFTSERGHTLGSQRKIAHNGSHGETGSVSDGGAITTLDTNCTFTKIPGPGVRTAYFAAFWSWSDVLQKNVESLRNSDALMRVAVPRRRGPAGLRNLFSFLSKLRFSHSVLRAFRVCET